MKKVSLFVLMSLSIFSNAQNRYDIEMRKALAFWNEGRIEEASNLFERIAKVESDNWLPYYYVAMVNTSAAFGVEKVSVLTQRLEKAKEYLEYAKEKSPNMAEILVQEAIINTAWISYDAQTYGMTLTPVTAELHQKALDLEPNNPRVVLSKAEWEMGLAKFFGKDTSTYCEDLERAKQLFATFKSDVPFYPKWGEGRVEAALKKCNPK